MVDAPSQVAFGKVIGRFVSFLADGPDVGDVPDEVKLEGTVTLTPDIPVMRWPTATPPRIAVMSKIDCPIINGDIYPPGTTAATLPAQPGVTVVASAQPNGQPTSFPWKASFRLTNVTATIPDVTFSVPAGGTYDLATGSSTQQPPDEEPDPGGGQTPTTGVFSLPTVPWDGGPEYWEQFAKADAAGWSDQGFFPISVFLSSANPAHVSALKAAGINTYMDVEHDPATFPLTNVTSQGMYAMVGWSAAEVGNNPNVVGWFISDEADMGLGFPGEDEYAWLEDQDAAIAARRALNDGRFCWANFGNGILRTYWSRDNENVYSPETTMHRFVQGVDGASADKYTYTSPDVANITDGVHDAPDWPNGTPVPRAYSYGWQVDQMLRFQEPGNIRPIWTFIETARPYLTETNARTITPDQIEGAVWSALIHGARGIAYFQHNNDSTYGGNYSIVDIPAVRNKLAQINGKVTSLAPVLNSPSRYNTTREMNDFTYYEYTFNNGTDTAVKTYGSDVYILAGLGMGDATGTKTFTVPSGATGTTVTVVGESRTIPVTGGQFTDTFPNEYTHHVYKISA